MVYIDTTKNEFINSLGTIAMHDNDRYRGKELLVAFGQAEASGRGRGLHAGDAPRAGIETCPGKMSVVTNK